MNKELLGKVRIALNEFESASPYDTREVEVCMEDLASQIYLLMEKTGREPDSLADAVRFLPVGDKVVNQLAEIAEEIQELLEVADYDRGEDPEDRIEELRNDFFWVFDSELKKWEAN